MFCNAHPAISRPVNAEGGSLKVVPEDDLAAIAGRQVV